MLWRRSQYGGTRSSRAGGWLGLASGGFSVGLGASVLSALAVVFEVASDGVDEVSQTHWLVSARGGEALELAAAPAVAPIVAAMPSDVV